MMSPHGVERARRIGRIGSGRQFGRQRSDSRIGLFGHAQGQVSQLAWRDGVDQRTTRVVDPVHILRLVIRCGERNTLHQLAGQADD